jgi:NADPH2:quinone reductase
VSELIELVVSGRIRIEIGAEYALSDVVTAHTDLKQRKTTGSTILIP